MKTWLDNFGFNIPNGSTIDRVQVEVASDLTGKVWGKEEVDSFHFGDVFSDDDWELSENEGF